MKTALIQHEAYKTEEQTIQKSLELIQKAATEGAELIVLQELH